MLGSIFGIETGFYGSMMSNLASMKMDTVVNDANATHLAPWLALLKEMGISKTPLSPFLHKQLLQQNHLCIDGSAIEAAGFKYAVPEFTEEGLRDSIAQAIAQGIFPVSAPCTGGPLLLRCRPLASRSATATTPHQPPAPPFPAQPVIAGIAGPAGGGGKA